MHGTISAAALGAIKAVDQTGNGKDSDAQTGAEPANQWFSQAARQLLGSDPGFALSLLVGVPDRTCYRYVSGERAPTAFIVAQLIRSEHGWQWLSALMEGSEPTWWIDIQRARFDSTLLRKLVDDATRIE